MYNEKFYVLDVESNTYKTFKNYCQLLYFFSNKPVNSIGNDVKDKRWQYKKVSVWDLMRGGSSEAPALKKVLYIVYDLFMNVVNCKQIDKDLFHKDSICNKYKWWKRTPHENYPGFRNGPVPWTGNRRHSHYYRRISTTQERRMNCAHVGYTRGKRRNIPNSWDDIGIADRFIKHSWKKVKKERQWM